MSKKVERLVAVIPAEGIAVSALTPWVEELEKRHGKGLVFKNLRNKRLAVFIPGESCWCVNCEAIMADDYHELANEVYPRVFIVCPDCGHQRCPRADNHNNDCSGLKFPVDFTKL